MTPESTPAPTAIQVSKPNTPQVFAKFLESHKDDLAKVAPKTLSAERAVRVAIAAYSRTPDLQKCTTVSVYNSVHQAVQLGFEPGSALHHCYLVPFNNKKTGTKECQLIISYPGFIDLARRTGLLASVEAHVVHERDVFDLQFGLEPKFVHRPFFDGDPGKAKLFYALFIHKDGTKHLEVMTKAEVDAIRARSTADKGGFSPWATDYEEMGKKTVLKRGFKTEPMSIELAEAIDADNRADPIDVTPVPMPAERPERARRVLDSIVEVEDDQPSEDDAPADLPTEADMLTRIAAAGDATQLREAGDAIEKARHTLGADAHARLIAAFQARTKAVAS